MVFSNKQKQRQPKVLPHLPKGVSIPEVGIPTNHHELLMPGQKPLPQASWKNQHENQLVPAAQNNRRMSVQRQGLPWTERGDYSSHSQPPPVFSANPNKKSVIRHVREPNTQKQVYRMGSGLDPVSLLVSRLECWKLAIKTIVALFKKIAATELKTSKGLIDASKEVIVPFEKANGKFLELGSGGIQDVWSSLRDYSVQHGILHHESAGYIEKSVVPTLRAIKTDIKTMMDSIKSDPALKSDAIFNGRLHIDKLIGHLDETIESCNRAPRQADQNTDPFLINLQIIHAIRGLCNTENALHDNLLNLQKEVGLFEQKIVENVRYVIQRYQEYRLKNKMEDNEFIGKVVETFQAVSPTMEWNDFVQRNQYNLILENSAYKTEDMIQYPSQSSNYCRAIKIGPLKAKTGALKGFSQSIHILTPAGFLHGYKSAKYFQEHPLQPSRSIFVPGADIEHDDDGSFQIRSPKRLSSNCSFRPTNRTDGEEWIDELLKISDQFRIVPMLEPTYYSSAPKTSHLPNLPAHIMPKPREAIGQSELDPVLEDEVPLAHPAAAIHDSQATKGSSFLPNTVVVDNREPAIGDYTYRSDEIPQPVVKVDEAVLDQTRIAKEDDEAVTGEYRTTNVPQPVVKLDEKVLEETQLVKEDETVGDYSYRGRDIIQPVEKVDEKVLEETTVLDQNDYSYRAGELTQPVVKLDQDELEQTKLEKETGFLSNTAEPESSYNYRGKELVESVDHVDPEVLDNTTLVKETSHGKGLDQSTETGLNYRLRDHELTDPVDVIDTEAHQELLNSELGQSGFKDVDQEISTHGIYSSNLNPNHNIV